MFSHSLAPELDLLSSFVHFPKKTPVRVVMDHKDHDYK